MKPPTVGITGPSGQVGSALLRHFHQAGIKAVAAVRNPLGAALCQAAVPAADIRIGSINSVSGAHLLDDCEVIINCAIESSGGIPRQAYTRNRQLVDGLLKARSLRWLIHFSSVAVYGELIPPSANEARARLHPHPTSEYGRSKLYIERYGARRAEARGIRCTILRLGHVYGASIARSREIVELSRDPAFRLPFDGRLPSNAIHVDRVGISLARFIESEWPLTPAQSRLDVLGLAEHHGSWRDIFDWHTASLNLPPVAGMNDAESNIERRGWADRSLTRDAAAWVRSLPIRSLVRAPVIFDLALRALVAAPDSLTRRVADVNRRTSARADIARLAAARRQTIPCLYFSSGVPGPFLPLAPMPSEGPGSDHVRARELREWSDRWSEPPPFAIGFSPLREASGSACP